MLTRSIVAKVAGTVAAFAAIPLVLWWGLHWGLGVWLPDIGGRHSVVASVVSASGHRFEVVQFWGDDFYTTRLEHTAPDGSASTAVIDGDDKKLWRCSLSVVEGERKVVIDLSDGLPRVEYSWETRWFILPPGQIRARA